MGVDVQGGRGVAVAEAAADGGDGDAAVAEDGGDEVAEVMEANGAEVEAVAEPAEAVGAHIGAPGVAVDVREEACVGCERDAQHQRSLGHADPVRPQLSDGGLVEGDAPGLVGLGALLVDLAVGLAM